MKRVILGILVCSLITSVMYAASYDFEACVGTCEILKKSIRARSAQDFKQQLPLVQQLHHHYITELKTSCENYIGALEVICEMYVNPHIGHELQKMIDERDGQISCLQMIWNLFPNRNRQRASELANLTYLTPLGYAIENIVSEFSSLSNKELLEKVEKDKAELMSIDSALSEYLREHKAPLSE